mgnify:CR=1 FL=1
MENEFTKGEWRVSLSNTSYADVVVDGFDICTCWSGYVGEDETKANAKLIASAPDLLNSIVLSVKAHPDYVNGEEGDEWHDIVELAEQTIKKATK